MRRLMMLATVVLMMVAMVAASAAPALARPIICDEATCPKIGGTALPTVVCETPAVVAPNIGWRNGQCWVFHPVAP